MADALEQMQSLREEIEGRLLANPDYRALLSLDRAIGELASDLPTLRKHLKPSVLEQHRTPASDFKMWTAKWVRPEFETSKVSQADAAFNVLKLAGIPMTTAELIDPVRNLGATLGGDDPAVNLSSSLSRDKDRFQSIRWNRRSCWWFKDVPIPPDPEARNSDGYVSNDLIMTVAKTLLMHNPQSLADLTSMVGVAVNRPHMDANFLLRAMIADARYHRIADGRWSYSGDRIRADQGGAMSDSEAKAGGSS